jgi:hypothetical protein
MSGPQSSDARNEGRTGCGIPAPGNKFHNWYRRNVKKDLAPVVYHDGVDAAIEAAGLK